MIYNWQKKDWPNFHYDLSKIQPVLISIAEKSGFIQGKMAHLDKSLQTEAMIHLMVEEAVKTSEIEGEYLSRPDVRSSIQNKLGLSKTRIHDKRVTGVVELMFNVRNTFKQTLTKTKLLDWHLMLMAGSLHQNLQVGSFRTHVEPMQIVSGREGKWVVHFEAPPAKIVPQEMARFIRWFNATAPGKSNTIAFAPVRAAVAHLYFESIHPFEDGNGRIGRAIAEKALSQGFGYPVILSLSQVIEADKKSYYSALHLASKSNEITPWIHYFVNVVLEAENKVENQIKFILKKSKFFDQFKNAVNERQLKVLERMIREGDQGFEGGISAKKYMVMTGASKATATRDLQNLFELGALKPTGSGRNVRYELNLS